MNFQNPNIFDIRYSVKFNYSFQHCLEGLVYKEETFPLIFHVKKIYSTKSFTGSYEAEIKTLFRYFNLELVKQV